MASSFRKTRIAASPVMYTNAVYWPNYRIYNNDTPGQLNYSCINRVYYAYASVAADGGVFVSFCLDCPSSPNHSYIQHY